MYQLMEEAVVGERFRDQWGRTYSVQSVDIRGKTIYARYDGDGESFIHGIIPFYYGLGDEPIDEAGTNDKRLEVMAEPQVE